MEQAPEYVSGFNNCAAGHLVRFLYEMSLPGTSMTALSILDLVRVTENTDARGR